MIVPLMLPRSRLQLEKAGWRLQWQKYILTFLVLAVVLETDAASNRFMMFSHVGTCKSSVTSKRSESRRIAKALAPKPEMATMMELGMAMFPPIADT